MTNLTAQTDVGDANAATYLSLADADSYAEQRGWDDWTKASQTKKTAALRAASAAVDAAARWPGVPLSDGLQWPRRRAYGRSSRPTEGVPAEVKNATMEAAHALLGGTTTGEGEDVLGELSPEVQARIKATVSYLLPLVPARA